MKQYLNISRIGNSILVREFDSETGVEEYRVKYNPTLSW